ncbi:MAG: choice-of-anchor A family protein [Oscillospiraceae bacterium]
MNVNFWLAEDFNIYVLNNHTQSNRSATGGVWVSRNALYNNYNVATALTPSRFYSLYVLGDVNITGGTNTQTTARDTLSTLTNYTMTNLNGVPNQPVLLSYRPYDENENKYLVCVSVDWASLDTNGSQSVSGNTLTLQGSDPLFNNFLVDSANVAGSGLNISAITSINLIVPSGATSLVSFTGNTVTLNSFTTLFNSAPINQAQSSKVLWNFPEATVLNLNSDIYGALLAPVCSTVTGDITFYGTIMTRDLSGGMNGVYVKFTGELPELYNPSTTRTCSSFTTTSSTSTSSTSSTSTTTTTTTTTTTSSTTTASVTAAPRSLAISDIIQSVAMEQTALSHILNAEGEKIQRALAMNLSEEQLLDVNKSVTKMVNSVSTLELVLQGKLKLFDDCLCPKKP